MPNFKVVGPDGKKWNVPAPEGATQEEAEEYVLRTKYDSAKPAAPKPAEPRPVQLRPAQTKPVVAEKPAVDFMAAQREQPKPAVAPPAPAPTGKTRREPTPLSLTSLVTEPALSMLTGAAGLIPSWARGLYGLATGESDPEAAAKMREVQQKLTYEPRTQMGKLGMETIRPAAEVLSIPSDLIGKGVTAATGSEVAGGIAQDVLGPEVVIPGAVAAKTLIRGGKKVPTTAAVTEPAPPAPPAVVPETPVAKPKRGRKPKATDLPVVKNADQANSEITKSEIDLSPDPELEAARIAARSLPENVLPGVKTGERVAPNVAVQKQITNAAKELLETGEVKIDPSIPPFLQVANLLQSGRLRPDVYIEILKKNDLTPEQFAQSYVQEVSQAGRTLQILSDFKKFSREAEDAVDNINTQAAGGIIDERGIFRRIEDMRRGLMVSQLSTAVRNATVGGARSILDTGTKLIDFGLQKVTGKVNPEMPLMTAGDAFGQVMNLLNPKQSYDLTKQILEVRPTEYDQLFRDYNAGVALGGKTPDLLGGAEKVVYALNVFNRFQDSVFRSAVFADSVERGMKARGLDFKETMKSGRMGDIPEDIIQRGVQDALEFTFSNKPKTKAEQAIVTAIDNIPGATVAIPFPRFMVNSFRFMTEYNPLGALHLMSKAEREAIRAGKTKDLSKALAGSALLYGAYALRDSEYAGEKWYELKGEDGETIDMRPYAPLSAYLFAADVIKRNIDGTLYDLKGSDISEAVLGIGSDKTGLQMVDGLLGEIRQDPEFGAKKAEEYFSKFAGEYAGTFFIPFQQIRDVMAEFEPEEAKVRRTTEDALAPVKAKLPVAGRELPESFSYTNPQPRERIDPGFRQVTGITKIAPKNEAEKEMDRLQIKEFEIFKRTGNTEADRLVASKSAALINNVVSQFVAGGEYGNMTNHQKRLILKKLLGEVNTAARDQAMRENPELFLESAVKKSLTKDELRVLEEAGINLPSGENLSSPPAPSKEASAPQGYSFEDLTPEQRDRLKGLMSSTRSPEMGGGLNPEFLLNAQTFNATPLEKRKELFRLLAQNQRAHGGVIRKDQGGLVTPGNIDVSKLPAVRNPDGTVSTVRSMSVNINGKEVLIPTVINGRVVSEEEAIQSYLKTGRHLGMFSSPEAATAYGKSLSAQEAQRVKKARGGYTFQEELLLKRYANR